MSDAIDTVRRGLLNESLRNEGLAALAVVEADHQRLREFAEAVLEHPLVSEQGDENCDWHCVAELKLAAAAALGREGEAAEEQGACERFDRAGGYCIEGADCSCEGAASGAPDGEAAA